MASAYLIVGIVEIVLICKFLSSFDAAQSRNEDVSVLLLRLTIRLARMIDEHRGSKAIDHHLRFATAEEIGDGAIFVPLIRDIFPVARTVVLADLLALSHRSQRVATGRVYRGGTNDQSCLQGFAHSVRITEDHRSEAHARVSLPGAS